MNPLRRIALGMALATLLLAAAGASAETASEGPNGERVTVTMGVSSQKGPFYKGGGVPADLRVEVKTSVPDSSGTVLPTRKGMVRLPPDLAFHPKKSMPVCTDAMMNSSMHLSIPPREAIALCPDSVIGNGSSVLFLAGKPIATVEAVLLTFHAGWTSQGHPKIKIWAFTKSLTAGMLMEGALQSDNSLEIKVPPLPVETAIGSYDLNVPGNAPILYEEKPVKGSVGLDKSYVQASCSLGIWRLSAIATLGKSQDNGDLDGPEYAISAPEFTQSCQGRAGKPPAGKARIGKVSLRGPATIKQGRKGIHRVSVTNPGGSALMGVRVTVRGRGVRGSARIGVIPAGKSRSARIPLIYKQRGRVRLVFKMKGTNSEPKRLVRRVRVR